MAHRTFSMQFFCIFFLSIIDFLQLSLHFSILPWNIQNSFEFFPLNKIFDFQCNKSILQGQFISQIFAFFIRYCFLALSISLLYRLFSSLYFFLPLLVLIFVPLLFLFNYYVFKLFRFCSFLFPILMFLLAHLIMPAFNAL